MVHCRSDVGKWKHAFRSWQRGYGRRPRLDCPLPQPPPPPVFHGVEKTNAPPVFHGVENTTSANAPPVFHGVEGKMIRARPRWEDISDSDDPDEDDQKQAGTQTEQPADFPSGDGDAKDCCNDTVQGPSYTEMQQMLIEAQNFTIRLLCEKNGVIYHSPFCSRLNPQAETFVPSVDAPPPAQDRPTNDTRQPAQEVCLSELIPSIPVLPEKIQEVRGEIATGLPEMIQEVQSEIATVATVFQEVQGEIATVQRGIAAVKQELDVEKITKKVLKLINASSARDPDLPSVSSACDPCLCDPVCQETVVFNRESSDAYWCLEPDDTECMLSCKDIYIVGFWNTIFSGASRVARRRSLVFPLMCRKNPVELVGNPCPGCTSEITSNVCFACDYGDKNAYFSDGFCNYSPISQGSREPLIPLRPNVLSQSVTCMNEQNDNSFNVMYSNQQHMNDLTDSECDDSEDSYERNASAYWYA